MSHELPDYLKEHLESLAHQYRDIFYHLSIEFFGVKPDELSYEQFTELNSILSARVVEYIVKAFAE